MAGIHICEDDLECYALGRLPEAQQAPLEEHLLVCADCRDRLDEWNDYTRAMRAALSACRDAR
jgi:anti-sigma factor RsiW